MENKLKIWTNILYSSFKKAKRLNFFLIFCHFMSSACSVFGTSGIQSVTIQKILILLEKNCPVFEWWPSILLL